MFVAHYENTMRNARPVADAGINLKRVVVALPVPVLKLVPSRPAVKRRLLEVKKLPLTPEQLVIQRQRMEADDSIRDANIALGRFNTSVLSFTTIVRRISKATGVSALDIFSPRRQRRIVLARQAVIYWCYRRTLLSLPQIGRHLNNRDHTTIFHAYRIYPVKRARMGRTLRALDRRQAAAGE